MPQAHGGAIGQAPFVPTEEQRARVRDLAKVFPVTGERYIARLLGIDRGTLRKHFADDLEMGRAQILAQIGGQVVSRAVNADAVDAQGNRVAKGDQLAQHFFLARNGWSTRVEHSGPDGGPIRYQDFDTGNLTPEEKRALLPVLDKLLGEADGGADDAS